MKTLITGGAGFIGSHLAEALIEKSHDVLVIDNLSVGNKKFIPPKAKFFKEDILEQNTIKKIFKKERPEIVFHLAAKTNARESLTDPLISAENNFIASIKLIELARANGVEKFIFASTGGVYGDSKIKPTSEDNHEWPATPYGITKLAVDKYLKYTYSAYGMKYTSLRFSNVYGPRKNPDGEAGVVGVFISQMLKGVNPIINGDGKQARDFIFVDDIVRANVLMLENINTIGVFNVATSKTVDINSLFSILNELSDKKFKEEHREGLPEQRVSCLDNKKIKETLGWEPIVEFKDGIKVTWEWFEKNIDKF